MNRRPMATRIEDQPMDWASGWSDYSLAERIVDAALAMSVAAVAMLGAFYGLSELVIRGVLG